MKGIVNYEDQKKFIDLVRQYPPLYDPSAKCSVQATADIWAKITDKMKIPSMHVALWKTKWKCLRDTFVKKFKEIKMAEAMENESNTRRGKSKSKKSKRLDADEIISRAKYWRFFKHMMFLEKFIVRTNVSSNTIPNKDESEYQHYTIVKSEDYTEGDFAEEGGEEEGYTFENHEEENSLDVEEIASDRIHQNHNKNNNNNDVDVISDLDIVSENEHCDWNMGASNSRSFFMSCAYRLDKLPQKVQSYLQLQIAQLFFNAENPDVPPVTIMPLPSLPPPSKNHKS